MLNQPCSSTRRTWWRSAAISVFSLAVTGCVHQHYPGQQSLTHDSLPPPDDTRWQGAAPELTAFEPPLEEPTGTSASHKISDFLVRTMRKRSLKPYQLSELSYPSSGDNGQPGQRVRVRLYRGDVAAPAPLVIILPIWGTFEYPSEKLSWKLRQHFNGEVHIAQALGDNRLVRWQAFTEASSRAQLLQEAQQSADNVRVTATDIGGLLRWAEQQPDIDAQRIVLLGFSIGSIVGSLVGLEEPDLAATILVFGALNPAEVISHCNRFAGDIRETVLHNLDMTTDEYLQVMHQAFDPLDWGMQGLRADDPSRFLIIDAANDDCMPETAREALWEGLGKPERYTLRGNHRSAFVSTTLVGMNYSSRLIVNYIEQRVQPPAP
jgi:dienelactone hydrolase